MYVYIYIYVYTHSYIHILLVLLLLLVVVVVLAFLPASQTRLRDDLRHAAGAGARYRTPDIIYYTVT